MVLITIHFASAITIQDNFDDGTINASMWTGTGITESSNRARISAHLDYLAFNVSGQANIDSDVNMTVNVSLNPNGCSFQFRWNRPQGPNAGFVFGFGGGGCGANSTLSFNNVVLKSAVIPNSSSDNWFRMEFILIPNASNPTIAKSVRMNVWNITGNNLVWEFNSSQSYAGLEWDTYRQIVFYNSDGANTPKGVTNFSWSNSTDTTTPKVFAVVLNQSVVPQGGSLNVSVNVTDDTAVDKVILQVRGMNITTYNVTMTSNGESYNATLAVSSGYKVGMYNLTFFTNDTSNNRNDSVTSNFSVSDVMTPRVFAVVLNQSVVPQGGSLNVSVNVTDDTAVDKVILQVRGMNITTYNVTMTSNGESYNATLAVSSGYKVGMYNLTFFTNDTGNNRNDSVTANFSVSDVMKPKVFGVTLNQSTVPQGGSIIVNVNVTDDTAVDKVILQVKGMNITTYNVTMTASGQLYNTTLSVSSGSKIGMYNLTFFTNDTSNNRNDSVTSNYSVLSGISQPIISSVGFDNPISYTSSYINVSIVGHGTDVNPNISYSGLVWINRTGTNGLYNNTANFSMNLIGNNTNVSFLYSCAGTNCSRGDRIYVEAYANDNSTLSNFTNSTVLLISNSLPEVNLSLPMANAYFGKSNLPLFSWVGFDNDTSDINYSRFYLNGTLNSSVLFDSNYSLPVMQNGSYSWRVEVCDLNVTCTNSSVRNFFFDDAAPSVGNLSFSDVNLSYVKLSFNVSASTNYTVLYGTDFFSLSSKIAGSGNCDNVCNQSIGGLASGTKYHFQVIVGNNNNITGFSSIENTTTTLPAVGNLSFSSVGLSSINLSFNTSIPINFSVLYGNSSTSLSSVSVSSVNCSNICNHSISGLLTGTQYFFKVIANSRDNAGHTGNSTIENTTTAKVDLANLSFSSVSTTSLILNFNTSTTTNFSVLYGTNYLSLTSISVGLQNCSSVCNHSISGLSASTLYFFQVVGSSVSYSGVAGSSSLENQTTSAISTPSGGGGGAPPAPTPINPVGQNLSFALISDGGNQKDVQVFVSQGGIRKRSMILKPGIADSKIKISCVEIQGTICKYVNLNETSFSLKARSGDVIVPYEISLPEEVANSNFIFLINATDENLNSDSVRVSVSVSDLGLIFEYFGKLIQFKIYNNVITGYQNIEIPILLIVLFWAVVLGSLLVLALNLGRIESQVSMGVSLLFGIFVAVVALAWI